MSKLPMTLEVAAMQSINISGNVIPVEWYKSITKENGKPDLVAIQILADIVYWYRPTVIRDEISGAVIEYRRKFKGEYLQKSYKSYADMFGLSEYQIKEAIVSLEKKYGVIKREFRTVHCGDIVCNNVLFVVLFPDRLSKITIGGEVELPTPLPNSATEGYTKSAHTNTENTPETTTQTNNTEYNSSNNNSKTAEILKVKQNYQQVFTGVSMQECDVICDLWNDFATHKVKDADRVGLTMKINTALNIFNLTMDGLIETINNYKEAFLAKNTRSHPHTIGRFLDGAMKNYTPGFYALDNYVWTEKKPSDNIDFNNLLDIG